MPIVERRSAAPGLNISHPDTHKAQDNERKLPSQIDVVIVGAGIAGKSLAAALGNDVSYVVIDSRAPKDAKEAFYLVTPQTASRWGIPAIERGKRHIITAATIYSVDGGISEEIRTSGNEGQGFAATPQKAMERYLHTDDDKIFYGTKCREVEDRKDSDGVTVRTDNGEINARIVIDATGWEGNIMHQYYGDEEYRLVAVYGGNYRIEGFDPTAISKIKGLPYNNTNWVMPIRSNGAEVAVSQYIKRSNVSRWRRNHEEEQLKRMVEWYRSRDQIIFEKAGSEMGYRMEPAKKIFYKGRVIPFGEAAGLNSPLTGQLIDVLPEYAKRMVDIINDANEKNTWDKVGVKFYKDFITNPPYIYLLHNIIRRNNFRQRESDKKIIDAIQKEYGPDHLWEVLNNNGIGPEEFKLLAKRYPLRVAEFAVESIPSLAALLVQHPELYLQTLRYLVNAKRKQN